MKHKEYIIPIGEEAKEFDEIFIGVIRKQPELIRCKECAKDGTTDCPMCAASYADDKIYEVIKWNYPLDYCLRGESKECGLKN